MREIHKYGRTDQDRINRIGTPDWYGSPQTITALIVCIYAVAFVVGVFGYIVHSLWSLFP